MNITVGIVYSEHLVIHYTDLQSSNISKQGVYPIFRRKYMEHGEH